jgi:hypothetical protein
MSETTSSSSSGGIGFLGLLTVLFIGLKLTHVITWSWLLVLSPLLFSLGIFILFLFIVLVVFLFALKRR